MTIEDEIAGVFPRMAPRVALYLIAKHGVSYDDAVDVVQEVFASLLDRAKRKDLPEFASPEHLPSYIVSAATSRAIDQHRHLERRRQNAAVLWPTIVPAESTDAEAEMISREQSELLWSAIVTLPEPYRSIFTLLLSEELSLADIARRLGTSQGSIYTQYARGLRRLKDIVVERL